MALDNRICLEGCVMSNLKEVVDNWVVARKDDEIERLHDRISDLKTRRTELKADHRKEINSLESAKADLRKEISDVRSELASKDNKFGLAWMLFGFAGIGAASLAESHHVYGVSVGAIIGIGTLSLMAWLVYSD